MSEFDRPPGRYPTRIGGFSPETVAALGTTSQQIERAGVSQDPGPFRTCR